MLPSQNCRNDYDSDSNLGDISEKFNIIQFSELDENERIKLGNETLSISVKRKKLGRGVRNRSTSQHRYLK